MSVHAKKPRTKGIEIIINKENPRRFLVPKSKVMPMLRLIEDYELEDSIPWREASSELLSKYSEAGAMVRGARVKESLTQTELAKKLKIPQQHISEMENGKRPIGKNMAKRLAKIFHVDYRVFL